MVRASLNPRTESEAIYGIRRAGRRRRWSAQVIATVGIIPIALYLLRRDAQPFSIFPPPRVDDVAAHPNFCWIAVGLIAARSRRLVGHEPGRVELFVQRHIGARMRPMFLRVCRLARCDDKKRNEVPQGGALPWTSRQCASTAARVIRKAQYFSSPRPDTKKYQRRMLITSGCVQMAAPVLLSKKCSRAGLSARRI